jgi:heat-inducible transcriptional repressor
LLSAGQIENRLLSHSAKLKLCDIDMLTNALNSQFAGKTLDAINSTGKTVDIPDELPAPLRTLYTSLSWLIHQCVREITNGDPVYLEGATEILKQPEFRDIGKLESILETLQHGALMFHTTSRVSSHLTVVIGGENDAASMKECSVVTAPYYVGVKQRGTIGVIGPTRMNYDKTVPAVNFFAQALSKTLTYLSA